MNDMISLLTYFINRILITIYDKAKTSWFMCISIYHNFRMQNISKYPKILFKITWYKIEDKIQLNKPSRIS